MSKKKLIYTEKELPQKSQEWLNLRKEWKLGASEIPVIMGTIPPSWRTPYDLFLSKIRYTPSKTNEDIQRGHNLEESVRRYVEEYFNNKNFPLNRNVLDKSKINLKKKCNFHQLTVRHKESENIFASFDGIDFDNKLILEIKCPNEANFKKLLKNPKLSNIYRPQVQTQLMVANSHWGIDTALFVNYFQNGIYVTDEKTKNVKLIRLIILIEKLDKKYCKEILKRVDVFSKMLDNKSWNKNWNKDFEVIK